MLFKNHLIPTSFLILSTPSLLVKANFVVIECKFPCADNGDVCQVSDSNVQCKPKTDMTRWVLKDTMSLPEYQGSLILLGQPCITAPHPTLKNASRLSKNSSETSLEWPPNDAFDSYYSNCANGLYCDRARICVKQLARGGVCQSDNQCLDRICADHTCVQAAKKTSSQGSNTVHIIASVIGVTLFLVVVTCIYLFKRRQLLKTKLAQQKDTNSEQPAVLPKIRSSSDTTTHSTSTSTSTTSSALPNNSSHSSINMLHPAYDSHFQQDSSRTPSMQQQQLQYQLQRQILSNKTNSSATQENYNSSSPAAPPPYAP